MSIQAFRHVQCSDEGCNIYECLNCYSGFEIRSYVGWGETYINEEYKWRFCPYCGCQWKEYIDSSNKTSLRRDYKYMDPRFNHNFILEKKTIWEDESHDEEKWEKVIDKMTREQAIKWKREEEVKEESCERFFGCRDIFRIRLIPAVIRPAFPDAKQKHIYGYERGYGGHAWCGFINSLGENVRVDVCSTVLLSSGSSYGDEPPTALPDHRFVGRLIEATGQGWNGDRSNMRW